MVFTVCIILLIFDVSNVPSRPVVWDRFADSDVVFVLSYNVLASFVDKLVATVSEQLIPSAISLPDMHVDRLSCTLNIP
jgi:hypothetical protein